jgi:hypothetical protein
MTDARAHWPLLVERGCMLKDWSGIACEGRTTIHHAGGGSMLARGVLKGKGSKNSDWLTLPLCERHHQGQDGVHTIGVRTWELLYGAQADWLDLLAEELQVDLWAKAKEE